MPCNYIAQHSGLPARPESRQVSADLCTMRRLVPPAWEGPCHKPGSLLSRGLGRAGWRFVYSTRALASMRRGPTPRDAPHAMAANEYMGEPHRDVSVERSKNRGAAAPPPTSVPVDVVMGRFDRFVRRGFVDVLRDHEGEVRVVAANLSDDAFEATVLSGRAAVAVMDQSALPALALRLRAARPDIGLVVLVGKPAVPYGMALFAWGSPVWTWILPRPTSCTRSGSQRMAAACLQRPERGSSATRRSTGPT